MKAVKRHQEIIELVQAQGFVSTDELVERFNVSPQTIRRDLNELADANKLRRNLVCSFYVKRSLKRAVMLQKSR